MELRIVVWNLNALSEIKEPARLQRAEKAFRTLAANKETAAFALVELGSDTILEYLANSLGVEWMHFSGVVSGDAKRKNELRIGLLLDTRRLLATTLTLNTPPHFYDSGYDIKLGREPVALFQVECNKLSFLLAVVHFKAEGSGSESHMRKSLAVWLRNELEELYKSLCLPVIIVGDFNGEPCEAMFGDESFRAFWRADVMSRSQDTLKLYNPMWRLLPDTLTVTERRAKNDDQTSRPYGTLLGPIWHSLIDGVLVSGEWLNHQRYVLHDGRLEILTGDLWHHISNKGVHHSRPICVAKELAISDHLPIAVNLEII